MILRYLQEPKKICTPNYKETCKKVSKPITRTYREKVCQKCRQRKPKEVVIKVPKEECFYENQPPICEPTYEKECKDVPEKTCKTKYKENCTDTPKEKCKPVSRKKCRQEPMQVYVT